MGLHSTRASALALSLSVGVAAGTAFGAPEAFLGAQGFGAEASGGRAGSIYVVTNLNDSGAGSFRDAVSASNRIVVFAVSGQINLQSAVSAKSNLTILGQTAPGQGIAIQGREVSFDKQSNDIVQYMRFREGSVDPNEKASINLGSTTNVILDHVSVEYAQYDNIDAVGTNGVANLTLQNCILANPIKAQQFNMHTEGTNVTYLANIWANAHNRNPLAKSDTQYINNIVYDYQAGYTTGNSGGHFNYDILNNYFIAGPSTSSANNAWYQLDSYQSAYASGNLLDSNKDGTLNGSATTPGGVTVLPSEYFASTRFLPTLSATDAFYFTTAHAGDMYNNGNGTFGLDQVDTRVVADVLSNGTAGHIYNSENTSPSVGFGTIPQTTVGPDTLDTVPFAWLTAHGLSTTNAADLLKKNALGYTMLEQYAYEVSDAYASKAWTNSAGSWVSGAWSGAAPGPYDHAYILGNGVTNGAATISGSDAANAFSLNIGGNGPAGGGESLTVSGGSLTVQSAITVGDQNNGTLNISGGTVFAYNIQLGNTVLNADGSAGATYNGTLNFTGGTLLTQQIVQGGGMYGAWNSGGSFNWSGNATIQALGNFSISVPTNLGAGGGTFDSGGFSGSFSGNITGSGGLTKMGDGVVTLSGSNSYTGGTALNGGEVIIASDANIGGANSVLTFNGGMLGITGTSITNFDSHVVNWSSFNGGFDITNKAATIAIHQNISGGGSLTVDGAGTLVLTGTNTYTGGTYLNGGELSIASDASIGGTSSKITFNGGVLQINGAQPNIDSHVVNWSTFSGGFDIVSAGNTFTVGSAIGGSGNFIKAGAGALVLNNANTFTGTTTISGGTLRIGNALALQNSTVAITGAGASLDVNHLNATIGGLSGNQPLDLENTTLTVGNNGGSSTFTGSISSTGGPGRLIKTGAGELTLGGNSSYGNTTISAGDIRATSNNALGSGTVTINIVDGLELANGVTLPNNIVAAPGANEFADVPDAGAAATLAGDVSITGGSNQYRLGISASGAVLTLTGTHSTNTLTLITRGNIVFAGNGSLTSTQAINIGRNSSGSAEHLTLQDNAFLSSAAGINLGGINGTSDDGNTTVTLNGNASLNAGTKPVNLNNSDVSGTTTLTLNGNSTVYAGGFTTGGSKQGQSTLNVNGGTIVATASDGTALFMPALGISGKPLAATIQSGGMTINSNGFTITVAQPFGGSGGLTKTGGGSLTLTGANTFTGGVSAAGGTLVVANAAALGTGALAIHGGATVQLQASPKVPGLTFDGGSGNWSGTLDLAASKLVLEPATNKAAALAAARNQAATGAITSSSLPANFGIAVIDNAALNVPFTTFGGQGVDGNSVLIAAELLGDTNADGAVDLTDLSTILNHFGQATGAWTDGNFDNAATIDLTDLSDVLNNFGLTNPNASVDPAPAVGAAAAPEPASVLTLLPLGAGVLMRRRRRQHF
ncbi:MAG: autotransporter-associated beta strand repeat-containing protein [Phycisphaerae bacterium]